MIYFLRGFFIAQLLIISMFCNAQTFVRQYDLPVYVDGEQLKNAWAGGINSVQISSFDANLDGLEDLFLFDRIGSRIAVFLNMSGVPGEMNYKYTQAYDHLFPQNMNNWVLLRDMNCDGKKDICTNTGSSFRIFWNTSSTSLSFSSASTGAVSAVYHYPNSNPFTGTVYCIAADIPAFDDYDGDGDIDIWSWNDESTSMYLYINHAVENGDCSVPAFHCEGRCYGQFGESTESFAIFYGNDFECDFDVLNPRSSGERLHTGGTIMTIDLNQDGMKDIVIGDVTESNLIALEVLDNPSSVDSVAVLHPDFPSDFSSTIAADLSIFPAAFYIDVNNDNVLDLLVASNAYSGAEDRFSVWLYLNNGENDAPEFEFVQNDFLQDQMIEMGTNTYPVVFDVDRDGLKDLLISNRYFFSTETQYTSVIHYYRNVGTATNPAFELADVNWMNIPSLQLKAVFPAFGDLDGDGDEDLILGEQDGRFYLVENTASADGPNVFATVGNFLLDQSNAVIDVGQLSTPQIIDLEEDGLPDLVSGELNGHINYYKNVGTNTDYAFILAEDSIGDAVATSILGIQGRSVPFFYKNNLGTLELLVGTETGQLNYYTDIENNIFGSFTLVTNTFQNIDEGQRTSPFLSDITNDGLYDMFVGNLGGGVGYYAGFPVTTENTKYETNHFLIFPNPANERFTILLDQYPPGKFSMLRIFDQSGKLVLSRNIRDIQVLIDTANWPIGIYHAEVSSDNEMMTGRFLIAR